MSAISSFSDYYNKEKDSLKDCEKRLSDYFSHILNSEKVLFHGVSFRVKTLESALKKIKKKKYSSPLSQITDLIGGRVFAYFAEDVADIENTIRKHFEIDEPNSINKIDMLSYNKFGYTSRHIVCQASSKTDDLQLRTALGGLKFEIQIRTVLQHGWAEVEHELVYKSNTFVPNTYKRRFAASAASIEIIQAELSRLRGFENEIVNARIPIVKKKKQSRLDRAWFLAVLHSSFPNRNSWSPFPKENNFFPEKEGRILGFFEANGVKTVGQLLKQISSPTLMLFLKEYSDLKQIDESKIHHLPISLLICGALNRLETIRNFSDTLDAEILTILRKRKR